MGFRGLDVTVWMQFNSFCGSLSVWHWQKSDTLLKCWSFKPFLHRAILKEVSTISVDLYQRNFHTNDADIANMSFLQTIRCSQCKQGLSWELQWQCLATRGHSHAAFTQLQHELFTSVSPPKHSSSDVVHYGRTGTLNILWICFVLKPHQKHLIIVKWLTTFEYVQHIVPWYWNREEEVGEFSFLS